MVETIDAEVIKRRLATGDILAFSGPKIGTRFNIIPWIVRVFTRSEYSHIGVCVILSDIPFLLEAQIPEVKLTPLTHFKSYYHVKMDLDVPDYVVHDLLTKIGERYSKWAAIKAYFGETNHLNRDWVCTELVQAFLLKMGMDLTNRHTPSQMMYTLLSKHYKKLSYVVTKPQ